LRIELKCGAPHLSSNVALKFMWRSARQAA
jgi:hypothetical protein